MTKLAVAPLQGFLVDSGRGLLRPPSGYRMERIKRYSGLRYISRCLCMV